MIYIQITLSNNKSTVETIDLLSSDSDDSDVYGHSVKEVDLYNSSNEDRISIIDPTTDNNDTSLPQINLETSYPEFYLPSISADKHGDVLENEFL